MSANRIVLKSHAGRHEEGVLDTAGKPGQNIVLASDGKYDPGASAQGLPICVLTEDALQGNTVDDAYTVGDQASFHIAVPGDEIQVLVLAGQTIAKGGKFEFNADGKAIAAASGVSVGILLEDVSAPASDTLAAARIA